MRVLVLSLDQSIASESAPPRARMQDYAALVDELCIILPAKQVGDRGKVVPLAKNASLHYTAHTGKLHYISDAHRIARSLVANPREWLVTTQDPFELGWAGWRLKRRLGMPLELQVHIDFFSPYFSGESLRQWFQARLATFLLPRADGIRVVSQKIQDYLVHTRRIPPERITLLPVFTDVARIQNAPATFDLHKRYPQFKTVLLMASRLVKQKNIGLALRAVCDLLSHYPDLGLVIVGAGPEESALRHMVRALKIERAVVFEAWVNDLASYYKTADLFVLTSNYEGWGMTVVEAAAAGQAVVMSDVGCAREFLQDQENGLIVPVDSLASLVRAVRALIDNPALRTRFAENAAQSAAQLPSKETYLSQFQSMWKSRLSR